MASARPSTRARFVRGGESGSGEAMTQPPKIENTVENLRELLLQLYVSSALLGQERIAPEEEERLLDTVLAAGEGSPFVPLGLPFPRE